MIRTRRIFGVLATLAWMLGAGTAWAGGYELPDLGSEALGRGGAFTAKADDGTALIYNVAGLARQRGTRLLINGNLLLHNYEFQRAGAYPDMPTDPTTPYGGQPFPRIANTNPPFFVPTVALSTDFEKLDRWTFTVGVFTPSVSTGARTYPSVVNGAPAPQRYDLTKANLIVVYPTLAASVRVTKWFDIGLALHIVYGRLDLGAVTFADLGRSLCPVAESARCDAALSLVTSGASATASLGLMFRPLRSLAIGLNLRGPVVLETEGDVKATAPAAMAGIGDLTGRGTLSTRLPIVLRLGLRYIFQGPKGEAGDIELNGIYEAWGWAQGEGDQIKIPELGFFSDVNATLLHRYRDTFGVRLGGSYNLHLPVGVLTFRLGTYYDSAATQVQHTRLDFDTMEKVAGTVGLGYYVRGFTFNVGYAYVWSPERNVTNGEIRVLNGTNGTNNDANGDLLPVVNNGVYRANTQMLSLGVSFHWEELLKKKRVVRYQ